MMTKIACCIGLAAALVGTSAMAQEPAWTYEIADGKLVAVGGAERRSVELSAPPVALLVRGSRLYAALGADGVAARSAVAQLSSQFVVKRVSL